MTLLLVLARALHIGSALVLTGFLFFQQVIVRDPRTGSEKPDWWMVITRRLRLGVMAAFVLHLLSGVAWWWIVTATLNDCSLFEALDRNLLGTVLVETHFGQLWLWRTGFALVLGLLLFAPGNGAGHASATRDRLTLAVSGLLLVSLSWAAHAAAGTHDRALHLGIDLAHLAIAAIWPVGLIPLGLFLQAVSRSPHHSASVIAIVQRFSRTALAGAILLLLTGVANALFFIPRWSALVTTIYGELLLAKVALFLVMVALGAANRFSFLPALENNFSPETSARLRRAVVIESMACLFVILIVGAMGATSPPR